MNRRFEIILYVIFLYVGMPCLVSAQTGTAILPQRDSLSPIRIGKLLTENYIKQPFRDYGTLSDTIPSQIIYPEVCTWTAALRFSRVIGDSKLSRQLEQRYQRLMENKPHLVPQPVHVDNSVFGAIPLELYRISNKKKYYTEGVRFADTQWKVPTDTVLTDAVNNWIKEGLSWQTRFWIDDMYMMTLLQLEAFKVTKDSLYLDRMAHEMCVYLDSLQRPNGLFYHAPDVPLFWGRGNGWLAAGMTEMLRCLPKNNEYRHRIMDAYYVMMFTLKDLQHNDGLWGQLLDDPSSWTETSGSAMFTYAMIVGVKHGWLSAELFTPIIKKSWQALIQRINADGDVLGTCQATNKKNDRSYYLARKCYPGDLHGQAALLWCAMSLAEQGMQSQVYPHIYASLEEKNAVWEKINTEQWASTSWKHIVNYLEPYLEYCSKDSMWLASRLAMYWKPGHHYTQCYLHEGSWEDGSKGAFPLVKNQQWDHGEGNAPVPTLRMPGMRTWNQYRNVPLEKREPYNETGDMLGTSDRKPGKIIKVPYRETGHMIRGNQNEILGIATQAAFAWYMTGREDYAKMAASIFYPWLMGVYYMNPIADPEECSGGPGGWLPGGQCGFYDYESIHDDMPKYAVPVYDFLHDWLLRHPYKPLQDTGLTLDEVCSKVFKKFIDVSLIRLGNTDNWNTYSWQCMMPSILALDADSCYADGKGRNYYLNIFLHDGNKWHKPISGIMANYDTVTGLWPESSGYAFGTVEAITDIALDIWHAGYDIFTGNPKIEKTVLSVLPWTDARGNVIVFGDGRGGAIGFPIFENMLTYYTLRGDSLHVSLMTSIIQRGIDVGSYSRNNTSWKNLLRFVSLPKKVTPLSYPMRMSWSSDHMMVTMRNGDNPNTQLMACLYGGGPGSKHMSPNGLAMQLYGFGWALGPDCSGYESYWSPDYDYHQSPTGANTITPGYMRGPITVNFMEPNVPKGCYTDTCALSPWCQFSDISAAEKRRQLAIIRTSDSTGYYVDIFRSQQMNNDYIYHNLGENLFISSQGKNIAMVEVSSIGCPITSSSDGKLANMLQHGYNYFKSPQMAIVDKDFTAEWVLPDDSIHMTMWMAGNKNREIYTTHPPKADHSTTLGRKSPTPTIIVRQNGIDGFSHPYVAVFEPWKTGHKAIDSISVLKKDTSFVAIRVHESKPSNTSQIILSATDNNIHEVDGIKFSGTFAVVSKDDDGVQYLYLGHGTHLSYGNEALDSPIPNSAYAFKENGQWIFK